MWTSAVPTAPTRATPTLTASIRPAPTRVGAEQVMTIPTRAESARTGTNVRWQWTTALRVARRPAPTRMARSTVAALTGTPEMGESAQVRFVF